MTFIILDGAVGTELRRRKAKNVDGDGIFALTPLIEQPQLISQVHGDYLRAGADVITTAAYRTDHEALKQLHSDAAEVASKSRELTRKAVSIAREAVDRFSSSHDKAKPRVAGNLTTQYDCYNYKIAPEYKNARDYHANKVKYLLEDDKIDILLGECFNSIGEAEGFLSVAREALDRRRSNRKVQLWISCICKEEGKLLDGTPAKDLIKTVGKYKPAAVLFNCCEPKKVERACKETLLACKETLGVTHDDLIFGGYCNVEVEPKPPNKVWERPANYTSEIFVKDVKSWLEHGAMIVGGCCGTTPTDIAAVERLRRTFKPPYQEFA